MAPAPPPPPVTVPTGTQFTVELTSPLSTKTSLADDPVEARLASDLMVGSRRVASAGSMVRGSVREVTSGSKKIGAVPALRIDFNQLVVADGSTVAINARAVQKGQSEKGRDTAKIAGGTAAGAIIGHQIDDDKGKVIGGVLGGAAGAVAAQKTGTEVELAGRLDAHCNDASGLRIQGPVSADGAGPGPRLSSRDYAASAATS